MTHKIHDVGAAKHIGRYSDAIETSAGLRWLHTSGTPGVAGRAWCSWCRRGAHSVDMTSLMAAREGSLPAT